MSPTRQHSKVLLEVWGWKDKVYQETKDMSTEEWLRYVRKQSGALKKKYNLKLKRKFLPLH